MNDVYSRVTVVGGTRRIDLVLPTDEAVGAMTGDLIRLLDEPISSPPLHRYLVTSGGDVLGGDTTLRSARIADGSVLRLVGEEHLPPAPVVYDIAEETADDRDSRAWSFEPKHRRTLAAAVLAVLFVAASATIRNTGFAPNLPAFLAVGLIGIGVALGWLRHPPLSAAALVAGVVVGVHHVAFGSAGADWPAWQRWAGCALLVAVAPSLFALAGRRARGAVLGSAVACVLLALWVGGVLLDVPFGRIAAVLGVVDIAVLGFLPRAALMVSGVASFDDRRSDGQSVARRDVGAALSAAHEGLVLATVSTAVSAALAGVFLATDPTRWSVPLGALLTFVLVSRARTFPLTLEVVALVGAGTVVAIALVRSWVADPSGTPAGASAVLAGLAVLAVLAIALSLSEHAQARLRLVLDRLEMLAIVAMVPLAVGAFGTYGRLVGMF